MTKYFALIVLCVALLSVPFSGLAEGRNIIEFCQLYMNRVDRAYDALDNGYLDFDFDETKSNILNLNPDIIELSCLAGKAKIEISNMEIIELSMIPFHGTTAADTFDVWALKTIIAISVLEYDSFANQAIGEEGIYLGAIEKATAIWNEYFKADGLIRAMHEGKDVLVYSGENYDYWAHYESGANEYANYIAKQKGKEDGLAVDDEISNNTVDVLETILYSLNDSQINSLRPKVTIALISKKAGVNGSLYSPIIDCDLYELSINELEWIQDYIDKRTQNTYSKPLDSLEGSIICDYKLLKITTKEAKIKTNKKTGSVNLDLTVVIENDNDFPYEGIIDNVVINDWEVSNTCWFKVGGGHKQLYTMKLYLEGIGVEAIDDIETFSISFRLYYANYSEKTETVTLNLK